MSNSTTLTLTRQGTFTQLPSILSQLLRQRKITRTDLAVYNALETCRFHAGSPTRISPKQSELAESAACCRETVSRSIGKLETLGVILTGQYRGERGRISASWYDLSPAITGQLQPKPKATEEGKPKRHRSTFTPYAQSHASYLKESPTVQHPYHSSIKEKICLEKTAEHAGHAPANNAPVPGEVGGVVAVFHDDLSDSPSKSTLTKNEKHPGNSASVSPERKKARKAAAPVPSPLTPVMQALIAVGVDPGNVRDLAEKKSAEYILRMIELSKVKAKESRAGWIVAAIKSKVDYGTRGVGDGTGATTGGEQGRTGASAQAEYIPSAEKPRCDPTKIDNPEMREFANFRKLHGRTSRYNSEQQVTRV